MELRKKIILAYFLLVLPGSVFLAYLNYSASNTVITKQGYKGLENSLQIKADHIETILDHYKKTARVLAVGDPVRNIARNINPQTIKQINRRIKATIEAHNEIERIKVLNKNGIIIASSHSDVGSDKNNEHIFSKARESDYVWDVHMSMFTKNPVISVATKILVDNRFEGVLVVNYNLDEFYEIVGDQTGFGETLEIYLTNKNGYLIFPSKFAKNDLLVQEIKTENVELCFGHTEKSGGEDKNYKKVIPFLNYRGENVLGAYIHIPETQWCLLAEVSEEEFLSEAKNDLIRSVVIVSSILIFILTLIFAYFLYEIRFEENCQKRKDFSKKGLDKFVKFLSKIRIGYFFIVGLVFAVVYFFVAVSFFQGWQSAKFFDDVFDLLIFVVAFVLWARSLKIKNTKARSLIAWGAALLFLQRLMEIPLQEYQSMVGVLDVQYWLLSILLGFLGIFLILFGFKKLF